MAKTSEERLQTALESLVGSKTWTSVYELYIKPKMEQVGNIMFSIPVVSGQPQPDPVTEIAARRLAIVILKVIFTDLEPHSLKAVADPRDSME